MPRLLQYTHYFPESRDFGYRQLRPRFPPPCRVRQHDIVIIEGVEELDMADQFGDAAHPQLTEVPVEHPTQAYPVNRDANSIPSASSTPAWTAVDRARPAAWLPSCVTALGAPMRTGLSPRRSIRASIPVQPADTTSRASTSILGGSGRRGRAKRLRARVSQNAQRTVTDAYNTS